MSGLQSLANESYALLPPSQRNNGNVNIPQLQSGLEDVFSESTKLLKGRSGFSSGGHVGGEGGAAYLLATHGVNAPSLTNQITNLTTNLPTAFTQSTLGQSQYQQPSTSTSQQPPKPPLQTYLQNNREKIILTAIQDTIKRSVRDSEERWIERCQKDWKKKRARVLEEMGISVGGGEGGVGRSRMRGSMAGSTLNPLMSNSTIRSGHPSSLPQIQLQKLMMSYDAIIKQLNTYRKSKKPFPLLHYFSSQISGVSVSAAQANVGASALEKSMLARSGGSDEKTLQDLKQTYSLLTQLVAESADGSSPGERHYARIYTSEDPSDVLNKLVNNAKKYLEKEFEEYVNREIDIKKIQTGGVPGWGTRMAAWVSWEMQGGRDGNVPRIVNQLERIHQTYFWAELYYLLRAGKTEEALALAKKREVAMKREDKGFHDLFKSWLQSPDRSLPADKKAAFETDFAKRIKHNLEKGDPYKYAIYKLLGRCDIHKKNIPNVTNTNEDWTWLQLNLVREGSSMAFAGGRGPSYGLKELGAIVVKYGEQDVSEGKIRPFVYVQRLLLAGQFEKVIAYLLEEAGMEMEAVHVAIALVYYGLLKVPVNADQSDTEIFTGNTINVTMNSSLSGSFLGGAPAFEVTHCNFARLVQRYVRNFVRSDPATALQYIYLISLNADVPGDVGDEQAQACWDMIQAVILETKSYSLVLGDQTSTGPVPSALMRDIKLIKVPNAEQAVKSLVSRLATAAPADLPLGDRIELYKMAEQYDKIIDAINRQLADSLVQPGSGFEVDGKDELLDFVKTKLAGLAKDNIQVSSAGQNTANALQKLREAKGWSDKQHYEKSLAAILDTQLIPLDRDVPGITRATEDFKHVDDNIIRKMDKIVLMTMTALYNLNQQTKAGPEGGEKQERLQTLKRRSRALLMFSAQLRFRLSSETYSQLAQFEAFF